MLISQREEHQTQNGLSGFNIFELKHKNSAYRPIRVQNELPQDVPLLNADCFELKAAWTLRAQEKLLPHLLNHLEEFKLRALS